MLNLLLSLTLASLGFLLGWFFPDLEALITAFWVEREHHTSQMLRSYYRRRQFRLLRFYWQQNRYEYSGLVIHSAFFQLALTAFSFYIVFSSGSLLVSFLCLGFLARLFREQYRDSRLGVLDRWFWAINISLTKNFYRVYFGTLGFIFAILVLFAFR